MTLKEINKNNLYLVNLGGKVKGSHVELHDVRWVIGTKIEDTFEQLRIEWFGSRTGLHIDSYVQISFVDGYEIIISEKSALNCSDLDKEASLNQPKSNKPCLWFINLGGYDPKELNEQHHFRLVVANDPKKAKRIAMSKWKSNNEHLHTDNMYVLNSMYSVDNCYQIKRINNWIIDLKKDENNRSQEFVPDWYGFMRLDKN